jgi:predicted secreted protein
MTIITVLRVDKWNLRQSWEREHLQRGGIHNWKRRNAGSVYFVDKSSHILFKLVFIYRTLKFILK